MAQVADFLNILVAVIELFSLVWTAKSNEVNVQKQGINHIYIENNYYIYETKSNQTTYKWDASHFIFFLLAIVTLSWIYVTYRDKLFLLMALINVAIGTLFFLIIKSGYSISLAKRRVILLSLLPVCQRIIDSLYIRQFNLIGQEISIPFNMKLSEYFSYITDTLHIYAEGNFTLIIINAQRALFGLAYIIYGLMMAYQMIIIYSKNVEQKNNRWLYGTQFYYCVLPTLFLAVGTLLFGLTI